MKKFISDLEKNIKDADTKKYLIKRTEKLFNVFFNEIDKIRKLKKDEISKIAEIQYKQNKKIKDLSDKLESM